MREWEGELRALGYAGTAALVVTDLHTGEVLHEEQADRPFPAASTIKVPLLVLALQAAERGELRLEDRVTLRAEDQVAGAGVLHELSPGLALSWHDVLTLMIVVSDNTATNLLIERLGVAEINAGFRSLGLETTRLVGPLQLPLARQNAAQRRGERNCTSAREQAALLRRLWHGELLGSLQRKRALDTLFGQQYRTLIGRGVPTDNLGHPLYRVASKSGELLGVQHDVGLLLTPRPLAVALLSEGGEDAREHPDNRDVQALSAALWRRLPALGGLPPYLCSNVQTTVG